MKANKKGIIVAASAVATGAVAGVAAIVHRNKAKKASVKGGSCKKGSGNGFNVHYGSGRKASNKAHECSSGCDKGCASCDKEMDSLDDIDGVDTGMNFEETMKLHREAAENFNKSHGGVESREDDEYAEFCPLCHHKIGADKSEDNK